MKYYIDCGGHHGGGLHEFIAKYNMDESWTIYSFEPNRDSFKILTSQTYNNCKINFLNKAVWIENSFMLFRPEKTNDKYDGAGSTLLSEDKWKLSSGSLGFGSAYMVETIDLINFINNLKDIDFLVIKLDVEGAEYSICKKLIEQKIMKINDLHVEFHYYYMPDESVSTTNEIINNLKTLNINFYLHG